MVESTKDFEELLECFKRHEVKFVIVGAHALAHHAKPRYTKDLDIFVEATAQNGRHIVGALEELGFGGLGISESDFSEPGRILQLGVPPNRVDIMTTIDGVSFSEAWERRVAGGYGSAKVSYIGFEDLVRSKTSAARPQDLADLQTLWRSRSK
jgi:hypothetical protein